MTEEGAAKFDNLAKFGGQLREVQTFLAGAFVRSVPVVDEPACAEACKEHVTGNQRLTPGQQVDIYRRQYWLRHIDCLKQDYPGLAFLLGEDAFWNWAEAYLTAHPPRDPSLREVGNQTVDFSATYSGFPAATTELCREMVRYEFAFVDIFDGPAPHALKPEDIAQISPDAWSTARIIVNPRVARLALSYPVHAVRRAVKLAALDGRDLPSIPDPSPVNVALYRRPNLMLHFEILSDDAFQMLADLDSGTPLVAACEKLVAGRDEAGVEAISAQVRTWFQNWAQWGWFVDVQR